MFISIEIIYYIYISLIYTYIVLIEINEYHHTYIILYYNIYINNNLMKYISGLIYIFFLRIIQSYLYEFIF